MKENTKDLGIQRQKNLSKLVSLRDKKIIKIITGIRRSGKSTLMRQFIENLKKSGVEDEQIIFINFEDFDFFEYRDPHKLYEFVKRHLNSSKMYYLFFDEIQRVESFNEVIDSLFLKDNVDLYLTGSNSFILSSELATFLSGRYIEIKLMPFSFLEYCEAVKSSEIVQTPEQLYLDYIENTSFPFAVMQLKGQKKEIFDYLEGIYNTVIVKDISNRNKIADTLMFESVTRFVFDTVGSEVSVKKIADTMTSSGRRIDRKTVEKYISALKESYIIYEAKRFDVRAKEILKTHEKYYPVDVGLRTMLLGQRANDVGHILETIVFLELLRRNYKIYIGKIDDKEIDFIAQLQSGTEYYQVSATVRDSVTLERELSSLRAINDHYPKYLLTLDNDPECDYDGIKKINVIRWLLAE